MRTSKEADVCADAVLMAYTVGVYVLLIIGDNACGLITRLLSPAERAAEEQPGPLERVRVHR